MEIFHLHSQFNLNVKSQALHTLVLQSWFMFIFTSLKKFHVTTLLWTGNRVLMAFCDW